MKRRLARIHRALTEALESRTLLANAVLVKDIFAGSDSGVYFSARPDEAVVVGSKMFFTGIDPVLGRQPYVSDGTGPGTKMLPAGGIAMTNGSDPNPQSYVTGGGKVYFLATVNNVADVWVTDGANDTHRLSNFAGIADSSGPNFMAYANGAVFLEVAGALYKTTDAGGQTLVSSAVVPGDKSLAVGNTLFYTAGIDGQLWATDGTSAHLVSNLRPSLGANPTEFTAFNNNLFFTAYDSSNSNQLYRSDGNSASIVGAPFDSDAFPFELAASGGKLYFVARNAGGFQIWRSDGSGKTPITSLAGTNDFNAIRDLTDVNGTLYFTYAPNGSNRLLYKLVGDTPTRVGTATGGASGGTFPGILTAVGSNVYFSALDTNGTGKLFKSDGSSITLVAGDIGTDPNGLRNVNGKLFFRAHDSTNGDELHKLDDAGGGGTVEPPPPPDDFGLRLKIHPNKQGHTNEIKEGEYLTFEAIVTDATVKKVWWDFGDSILQYWGKGLKPTNILFPDNFINEETHQVRVKVQATDGRIQNAKVDLTIKNVAPEVKITMPGQWVTWAPMPFAGSVKDADVAIGNVWVEVNWNEYKDQPKETFAVNPDGTFSGTHVWTERMLLGREVRFEISDSTLVKAKKRTVLIDYVLDASKDAGAVALGYGQSLLVGGTKGQDRIIINQDPEEDLLTFLYLGTEDILYKVDMKEEDEHDRLKASIYTGDGNDRVEIDESIVSPFKIYGGADNDTLRGGSGNDSLFGQGGSDKLYGRGGKNKVKQ